ncbi:Sortase family protein [Micromonospora phaseoli]|uniref:Sortase family protein n=1 Tax=Micromonospora phaseoli TaxID=1144548 RepID=A0A1H6R6F9_9ACTN|nr:class F sortase [Micromonospora phaseoli]PZW03324.1 sortase family protein [Micromonospora phaseoli]SEI51313.1 Sortase family protein [Micromonospora phaseoli]
MTVVNRGALAAVAAGAAALAVAAVVAVASRPTGSVGAEQAAALASPSPSASGPSVAVAPGVLPADAEPVPPVRLRIPEIEVTARVNPVGVNERTGEFEVPPSVDQIGWYRYGPGLEAEAGSVVIAGHVDSAEQGRGAFYRLRDLAPGDTLTATGADGTERTYRVVAREEYDKTKIPLERYFARDGRPRLTLITCGGPFDADARRYRDNIVVTAEPV